MTVEEILAALQAIIDGAAADGERDLTDEEVERYEDLEGKLQAKQRSEVVRKRNEAYRSVGAPPDVKKEATEDSDDKALTRAFDHYIRTGKENQDIAQLRAQSVGTDSAGGFTVPTTMRNKLQERMKAFGGLASVVEDFSTGDGTPVTWPTIDDTANSGVIAAENTAPASGGADMVFGEKVLGAFKYVAPGAGNLPLRVSVELLQDSQFDIQSLVTRKLGERIGRKQAVDWVRGAGTTEPFGITTGTAGTAFTTAAPTYAALVAAVHEVDPEYRKNAKWAFNDSTMAMIESLVDANGRPLLNTYTDGVAAGPDNQKLLGYPVVIDQAFQTYTDGGTNKWGVFGDLNAGYVIRRVKELTLIVNPYTRANEGQVEYTLWARADGVPQDTFAYRVLTNAV